PQICFGLGIRQLADRLGSSSFSRRTRSSRVTVEHNAGAPVSPPGTLPSDATVAASPGAGLRITYSGLSRLFGVPSSSSFSSVGMEQLLQQVEQWMHFIEQWIRQQPEEQLYAALIVLLLTVFFLLLGRFFKRAKSNTVVLAGLSGSGKTVLFYQDPKNTSGCLGTLTTMLSIRLTVKGRPSLAVRGATVQGPPASPVLTAAFAALAASDVHHCRHIVLQPAPPSLPRFCRTFSLSPAGQVVFPVCRHPAATAARPCCFRPGSTENLPAQRQPSTGVVWALPQPPGALLEHTASGRLNAKSLAGWELRDGSSHQGTVTSMEPNDDCFILHSETEKRNKIKPVRVVDAPGHPRLRDKLDIFLPQAAAIVFVVDAVDFLPNCRAAAEYLYDILTKASVVKRKIPILILCNKTDKVTAHTKEFIRKQLEKEIHQILLLVTSPQNSDGTLTWGLSYGSGASDKLRTSRTALSTADVTNEYALGVSGEPFAFVQCNNKVSVADAAGLTGEITHLEQFIREHVKP
ncbi:hypothetical protein Taro_054654, partial [Colocasia esculenta]|nr:hypothetical protein [Colocasia esculenta]